MNELSPDAVFTGMEQCSVATGISIDTLKRIKAHPDSIDGLNGFHYSGRIAWSKLKPWYEEHGKELTTGSADDYFKWRAIKMEGEAKLVQIELEEKKNRLVAKDDVNILLRRIAAAQSSLMNSKFRQELVPKLDGLNETQRQLLMDNAITDFMNILQKEISKWK